MAGPISTIAQLADGWLYGHRDETSLVPRKGFWDAVKHRVGRWLGINGDRGGWLGGLSFNLLEGDESNPTQYEKCLAGVRHDDDFPKDVEAYEFVVMLQYPGERGDMGRRHEFLRITSQWVEFFGRRTFFNQVDPFDVIVSGMYRDLLGRDAEPGAIDNWRAATGGNVDVVRQGILGSDEYRAKHP